MHNEHQQSRRVGPPVPMGKDERGFVLMPLLIWLAGAAIEWGLARLACGGLMW
jgi:hypothetical protein